MMRIRTASRLHFGMFSLPEETDPGLPDTKTKDYSKIPVRHWGGVGLMVKQPGIDLVAEPSEKWSASGPLSERILHFVERFLQSESTRPSPVPCLHFRQQNTPPEHQGLGTGTQLGLAVARLLAESQRLPEKSALSLAIRVERGKRSALGIHGFDQGGFLVEAGKANPKQISPLVARQTFPENWRIILMFFPGQAGLSGTKEIQAFEYLNHHLKEKLDTNGLCQLVLLGMLPALVEGDWLAFGESLYEFNRRVGEAFAPVQGGVYAHSLSQEIVNFFRNEKIPGVGQSSWGPGLFAVVKEEDQATELVRKVRHKFHLGSQEVLVTRAENQGTKVVETM